MGIGGPIQLVIALLGTGASTLALSVRVHAEEFIARVNGDTITHSDYERSRQFLKKKLQRDMTQAECH
jgi:hypothetical protein